MWTSDCWIPIGNCDRGFRGIPIRNPEWGSNRCSECEGPKWECPLEDSSSEFKFENAKSGTRVGELQIRISPCRVTAGNAYSKIQYRNSHLRIPAACPYDSKKHFLNWNPPRLKSRESSPFQGKCLTNCSHEHRTGLPISSLIRTVWPNGLRHWLKAPVRKGVGSNPTAVITTAS